MLCNFINNAPTILLTPWGSEAEFNECLLALKGFGFHVIVETDHSKLTQHFNEGNAEFVVMPGDVARRIPVTNDRPYRILVLKDAVANDVTLLPKLNTIAVLQQPVNSLHLSITLALAIQRYASDVYGNQTRDYGTGETSPHEAGPQSGEPCNGERSDWILHYKKWMLRTPSNMSIELTAAESSFLHTLANSEGKPVARSVLIDAMGHNTAYYGGRRLDMFVSRLRKKIAVTGDHIPLRASHAYGYALISHMEIR